MYEYSDIGLDLDLRREKPAFNIQYRGTATNNNLNVAIF
jgi:hypothetical protein